MISQRLIVGLQIYKSKLIKTEQFKKSNSTYLGDVLNAVRIFNEKKVDELIIYDLTASKTKEIDFSLLEKISRLSRMPLCYGGGILSPSTFAWWAAFLCQRDFSNPAYIAPRYWIGHRSAKWYPPGIQTDWIQYD